MIDAMMIIIQKLNFNTMKVGLKVKKDISLRKTIKHKVLSHNVICLQPNAHKHIAWYASTDCGFMRLYMFFISIIITVF